MIVAIDHGEPRGAWDMSKSCPHRLSLLFMAFWPIATVSQKLPSEAEGTATAQIAMVSVGTGCAAGIIVGYDRNAVYIATAAHVAGVLSGKGFPSATVILHDRNRTERQGQFFHEFESEGQGDLAVVMISRDETVDNFLNQLDFAMLSPVGLGAPNSPVASIGCFGGQHWSAGTKETLLASVDQEHLAFRSNVNEGQSGGGLFNESWELIGMPQRVSVDRVSARTVDSILRGLKHWKIPIVLTRRALKDRVEGADEIARSKIRESTARQIATYANESLSEDPERSLIFGVLAVESTYAVDHSAVSEAVNSLHRSLLSSQVRFTLRDHVKPVISVAFSPDSKRIVTGSEDGRTRVWDTATGQLLLTLSPKGIESYIAVFTPDGKRIATANSDNSARLWDAVSGEQLLSFTGRTSARIESLAISPDGKLLATGDNTYKAKVWDATNGRELLTIDVPSGSPSVAFSPDSKYLATAFAGKVKIWSVEDGHEIKAFDAQFVRSVAFSPDGHYLVTAGVIARVWNLDTNKELYTVTGSLGGIESAAFSPDSKRLATADRDGTATIRNAADGHELITLLGHYGTINSVAFSPDGKQVATAGDDLTAKIWNAGIGQEMLSLTGHLAAITRVSFSPDDKQIAAGSQDGTAIVWDASNGKQLQTVTVPHSKKITSVLYSPDGRHLITGSFDGKARVWDAVKGDELLTLPVASRDVYSVALSKDGKRIGTVSQGEAPTIWDASNGQVTMTLPDKQIQVDIAFNPEGNRIATAGFDGVVKIWDTRDRGGILRSQYVSNGHANSVVFSSDGGRLAVGYSESLAIVSDTNNGQTLLTLVGHSGSVQGVAFSPTDPLIATASWDGTVKLWDDATGEQVLNLNPHAGRLEGVAFSHDGKRLAVGTQDSTVEVYALKIDELLRLARTRITRNPPLLTLRECQRYFASRPCPTPSGIPPGEIALAEMRGCLAEAGLSPPEIEYVVKHDFMLAVFPAAAKCIPPSKADANERNAH